MTLYSRTRRRPLTAQPSWVFSPGLRSAKRVARLKGLIAAITVMSLAGMGCDASSTTPAHQMPPGDSTPPTAAGLWIGSGNPPAIVRLATAQLQSGGDITPSTRVTSPNASVSTLIGVAFAPDGTLWISSADDSLLLAFAPQALGNSGSRAASTVIASHGGSLTSPIALAFDQEHSLWVANHDGGTLVRFDPLQLAAGGSPDPTVTISGAGHPTALAFDGAGSLWVADNLAHSVTKYDARQLVRSGSPAPAVVLGGKGGSLSSPSGLAFDALGNLWVANLGARTVVAFGPDQLTESGTHPPRIVLSSDGGSLTLAAGLAFDAHGNLWVVGAGGTLTAFARGSLAATGTPVPAVRTTISGHSLLWTLAFWPLPNGLPLN